MKALQTEALDLMALLAESERSDSGALVVFGGTVRDENEGRSVTGIEYSAYVPIVERSFAEIEMEAKNRFGVQQCQIVHRIGKLAPAEFSVLVVVRAAHRAEAFDAARYAIDTLKQRAAIWKKELYAEGDCRYLDGAELKAPTE